MKRKVQKYLSSRGYSGHPGDDQRFDLHDDVEGCLEACRANYTGIQPVKRQPVARQVSVSPTDPLAMLTAANAYAVPDTQWHAMQGSPRQELDRGPPELLLLQASGPGVGEPLCGGGGGFKVAPRDEA